MGPPERDEGPDEYRRSGLDSNQIRYDRTKYLQHETMCTWRNVTSVFLLSGAHSLISNLIIKPDLNIECGL